MNRLLYAVLFLVNLGLAAHDASNERWGWVVWEFGMAMAFMLLTIKEED